MSYQKHNYHKIQDEPQLSPADNKLLTIVIFLIVIGIMAIFSTTAQKAIEDGLNPVHYVVKQSAYLILGLFAMNFFTHHIDYKELRKHIFGFFR